MAKNYYNICFEVLIFFYEAPQYPILYCALSNLILGILYFQTGNLQLFDLTPQL